MLVETNLCGGPRRSIGGRAFTQACDGSGRKCNVAMHFFLSPALYSLLHLFCDLCHLPANRPLRTKVVVVVAGANSAFGNFEK